jgi:hypothetical protein
MDTLIETDWFRIGGLPYIGECAECTLITDLFSKLEIGTTKVVNIDLLDLNFYSSEELVEELGSNSGKLNAFYADDAIVSSARLILDATAGGIPAAIPEPSTTLLLSIGLGSLFLRSLNLSEYFKSHSARCTAMDNFSQQVGVIKM